MKPYFWVQFQPLDADWHAVPITDLNDPFSPFTTLCGKSDWAWANDDSEGKDDFNRCIECARKSIDTIYLQ
jgi:hypothetical protein